MAKVASKKEDVKTGKTLDYHGYTRAASVGEDDMDASIELDLAMQLKSPARKKLKNERMEERSPHEPSLVEVQANILNAVNRRADSLELMIRDNSSAIKELQRAVQFAMDDIQKLKEDSKAVSETCTVQPWKRRLTRWKNAWKKVKGTEDTEPFANMEFQR